jgi:hypothetical protein
MTLTKHQKRSERLVQIAQELERIAEELFHEELSLKQRIGMSIVVSQVQSGLNSVRRWSIGG